MPGQPLYIPTDRTEPVAVAGPRGKQKPGYGEFLAWEWARWIYNVGAIATITDLDSGLSFRVRHLGGSNHADSEPLTAADTAIMKQIFNGRWTWDTRAILLKVGGRVLAASMAGMPHSVETILDMISPAILTSTSGIAPPTTLMRSSPGTRLMSCAPPAWRRRPLNYKRLDEGTSIA